LRRGLVTRLPKRGDVERIRIVILSAATIALAACTNTGAPPPVVQPAAEDRFLVDPRVGAPSAPPNVDAKFDLAWRYVLAGDGIEAEKRLGAIRQKNPTYLPAQLAEAALLIRDKRLDKATDIVDTMLSKEPQYTAAAIYRAEIAIAGGDTRRAYDLYRGIAVEKNSPETARERVVELRHTLFDNLFIGAQSASDRDAIRMLR
jgi:Tfp pilus assembly protein PilF